MSHDLSTTIVVPLDGSVFAEAALRPAAAFAARAREGRVLLLTCCPAGRGASGRGYLAERADRFRAVVAIDIEVVASGTPSEAILDAVSSAPGSVLCMSTHGRGGASTALVGSVAHDVVRRSSGPILLVGPRCRTALLPKEIGKILVTSDGSAFSEAILPDAQAWARAVALAPWIVEVVGPEERVVESDEPLRNRQIEAGTRRLRKLATRISTDGEAARFEVLHGADIARSVVAFAERLPAAVVAMATHGRTGLSRTLMGSVTAGVLRRSPCPVLLVSPNVPS